MKYFGTDGFRGEANVDLTVEHAYKVGRFLGWYYGREHKAQIVIGKDTRRSSYMFEYSLVAGLTASGADAYLLHVTTTPSVSYVVRTENFDCGIMISASHNPFYDNGIKIIGGNGQKMDAEVEAMIEGYIDDDVPKIPFATKEKIGRTVDFAAGRNRYIGYLISIPTRSFKNYRVGLDCSNGSASSVAKSVFDALGAKTYVINNEPDGTILEGFLARGDRRCSKVILRAYEKGAIYDAWSESFDYNIWKESFAETNTDIDFYTLRERSTDEILPWDFIDAGVTKKFLIHEWEQAKKETVTPNCRQKCSGCGAMRYGGGVCYEGKN